MSIWSPQAASAVVMVRPHRFHSNPQTAEDNAFQQVDVAEDADVIAKRAYDEVTQVARTLEEHGVTVHMMEDDGFRHTPDSVFPNNWVTTHAGGRVVVYPMYHENRRRERRQDVLELLKAQYRVGEIIDYSGLEQDDMFFEGTGVLVMDHFQNVAYVARSQRAHDVALQRFCTEFGYEPVVFDTADRTGSPVYHTNVIMTIGTTFATVGFEFIKTDEERDMVRNRLAATGRDVVELTTEQIGEFAGNALELRGTDGLLVAMSGRAERSLTDDQRRIIEKQATIVAVDLPTIELAGGSMRCMLAGVHLTPRG